MVHTSHNIIFIVNGGSGMKKPRYNHVLNSDYPELNWELEGDYEYEKIQWHLSKGQTPPSKEELESKLAALQTEYDSKQYQRDRASAYPSIQEQLDMQYWDAVNGTKKWQEAVAKVKADNPKPE